MQLWIISVAVSRRKEKSSCLYVWVQFELFLNMSKLSGKLKMDQDVVGIKLGQWLLNYIKTAFHAQRISSYEPAKPKFAFEYLFSLDF